MPDAAAVLARIAALSPYFSVSTGPVPDGLWRPTSALRDSMIRDTLVSDTAQRMGTGEMRVAASTLFFGYAARMWSVVLGSVVDSGRCVRLAPDALLWCNDGGLRLHIVDPEFGSATSEILDDQLEPLIDAWSDIVAPGLMWGNSASALIGAGRVIGDAAQAHIDTLLGDPPLVGAIVRSTGRRRSCCLYYRVPGGGVCGDCVFASPPKASSKEIL
ncbi:FhuF-like iron-sulfur protein [Rhodococcus sp. SMB37]|uniref:(2Fe-2S)-binding protein n=1 Tax=Rhodococcus sp. SMB37 TaxID=2512213 RepID=UPI0006D0E97F|nr:(2Fe-2S)-binding protein [Rhodococcus sp. SMB37]TCN46262.1 FhuF-like iron-sulfur protein [Rhodococcus sp. SMB37]